MTPTATTLGLFTVGDPKRDVYQVIAYQRVPRLDDDLRARLAAMGAVAGIFNSTQGHAVLPYLVQQCIAFLARALESWDLSLDGNPVTVEEGLPKLPAEVVTALAHQVVAELLGKATPRNTTRKDPS